MLYEKIKPFLWDGNYPHPVTASRFICIAVSIASRQAITKEEADALLKAIYQALPAYTTLYEWLLKGGHELPEDLPVGQRSVQYQTYRHRWLKHLCEQYERQEIFDRVARHLLTQKERSVTRGRCRYRGAQGLKCAIGCLIPDELYRVDMEGKGAHTFLIRDILTKAGINTECMTYMLVHLQAAHDHGLVSGWPQRLRNIAKQYNLEWSHEFTRSL